ncbi:MAG TPA: SDR family oxidoreductase [Acidimicrobiia bacterium]|jgi:NAD(P)-dependent dehydrogenase (short-subunit alcohol dehydrogenase family)|nr:SDR family oxidoreductase [Acidimicrobiia bacterium]
MSDNAERVALVTGASRGLGLATARALAERGWTLVIDARGAEALADAAEELSSITAVTALAGDVTNPIHRQDLIAAATASGRLDVLVNNASLLGPSPQPPLADYRLDVLREVYEANVIAPIALVQLALPRIRETGGVLVNVTSDAAVEPYAGWGGYGSSKAALNQVSNILAVEEPGIAVYWFDPGDMNTQMHQEAFPGEDISDRPPPEDSVPALLDLIERRPPSGHYSAAALSASM